jgi:hypothetical protein
MDFSISNNKLYTNLLLFFFVFFFSANRFALLETKIALVHLLSRFELHTTSKTQLPLRHKKGFRMGVEGDFWCGFKLRKPTSNATSNEHE